MTNAPRFALAAALALLACRSVPADPRPGHADIEATIVELYRAFGFDAQSEPDWKTQRRIYLEGAAFVPAIQAGRMPAIDDTEKFIADFRAFATGGPYRDTGFHERIIGTRIESFGGIAHAFVAFEGFVPGRPEALSRGLDSLQLVHDGEVWRLVSFTTQYENEGLKLPQRFVDTSVD